MTDEKLREIFNQHWQFRHNPLGKLMNFADFVEAISDYEAEKAKDTCKWKDASTYSIIRPNKKIAPLYVSPHLSKIEGQRGCFISKQDLSNYEYCPYPGCGKPIEVAK